MSSGSIHSRLKAGFTLAQYQSDKVSHHGRQFLATEAVEQGCSPERVAFHGQWANNVVANVYSLRAIVHDVRFISRFD